LWLSITGERARERRRAKPRACSEPFARRPLAAKIVRVAPLRTAGSDATALYDSASQM
jgi:hypothetical protein